MTLDNKGLFPHSWHWPPVKNGDRVIDWIESRRMKGGMSNFMVHNVI